MAAIFRSRAASPACVMAEAEAMGSADDLESDANCNLCCTPADEFVFLACGHEMCRGCLQKHMTKRSAGRFCPSCFARDVLTYEMLWVRGAKPTNAQVPRCRSACLPRAAPSHSSLLTTVAHVAALLIFQGGRVDQVPLAADRVLHSSGGVGCRACRNCKGGAICR